MRDLNLELLMVAKIDQNAIRRTGKIDAADVI